MTNTPESAERSPAHAVCTQLESDLIHALNWASIDALANTPDYTLAAKMIDAPSLDGYRKAKAPSVEPSPGMPILSEEDERRYLQRKIDQAELIEWILHYKNPIDDEARLRQVRLVME